MSRDRLLSLAEVAERFGLGEQAVRRAIARGELQATKVCGRIKIRPADVDEWFEAGRIQPQRPVQPQRQRAVPAANSLRQLIDNSQQR
jgi:excisionase family DNA binding protein